MKIVRTSATTICPSVREELLKRKEDTFYNLQRELRHPLGIYNLSLMNIWATFEEVLDELDNVLNEQIFRNNPPDVTWGNVLLRRQEDLISRLMRHFDDCLSILCCFYPVTSNKSREKDRDIVMKKSDVKVVMNAVKLYRDHIANIMNHIKHYQGMIRGVVVFNDNTAIVSYYIEHINKNGIIEPHPDVHPQFRGMHTAFSFNRNLRFLFWMVYAVSDLVSDVIRIIHPKNASINELGNLESQTLRIAKRLEGLPKYLFNDENAMDFPEISAVENNNLTRLILEYPSITILPTLHGRQQVLLGWVGDGITKSYQLPYYNTSTLPKIYKKTKDSE